MLDMRWAVMTFAWSFVSTVSPAAADSCERDWHAGLNMRTDFGARFFRADAGVRLGRLDLIAVLDPLGLRNGDYDLDALVRYESGRHWSIWGGARVSVVPVGRDFQLHDKLLVGVSGLMPPLFDRVRVHAGLELAIHMVAHGAGLPAAWVCVDSIECRRDHFVFSLFSRVEYASAF